MWINELSNLYLEQGGPNQTSLVHGQRGTFPDKNTAGMQGLFGIKKAGLAEIASAQPVSFSDPALSQSEEDQMISKDHVLSLLHKHIEQCNDSTTKFNLLQIIKEL